MNSETEDKRIHVLIFESDSSHAIEKFMRKASRHLPPRVNVLRYKVDDSFFRMVLAGLREGAALSSRMKK